ncbi:MAG TPA: ABC transporter permease [Candidatus Polarisedimenticolia bacterium]|nr:ABC transporter permease [Candidatus Polarisedimenticolia bacterium]
MTLLERVRFASTAVRGHLLRSSLTLLGFAIGVAAVVLLTALGEGARGYVTDQFMSLGSNLIVVLPGKTETTGNAPIFGGTPRDLTIRDMQAVRQHLPRIRRIAPLAVGSAQAAYGDRRRESTIVGTTAEYSPMRRVDVAIGQFLPEIDPDREEPVAVLGQTVRHELFGEENPLGRSIRIGDFRYRVIGVIEPKGQALGMNLDEIVFVPVASALRVFNQTSLFRLLIEVGAHSEIDDVRKEVLSVLKARHDGEEDVTVVTQDSVLGAFNRILAALTLSLAGIAAISLSVAGIGIMNVMLVSVSERTAEIGLLKAIGAPPREIERVFLVEAVLLAVAGGALGLTLGYIGAAILGQAYPALPAEPPLWAVGGAIVVSFAAGIGFGVLPARRAARLDPVAALSRH